MSIIEIIVAVLVIISTIFVVATASLQLRAPDALTRANLLGPLVCLAFPLLIVANLLMSWSAEGFSICPLYTSPSPRDVEESRMPSSA